MDTLQDKTAFICKHFDDNLPLISRVLADCGVTFKDKPLKGYLKVKCPVCEGKAGVRYRDSSKEFKVSKGL